MGVRNCAAYRAEEVVFIAICLEMDFLNRAELVVDLLPKTAYFKRILNLLLIPRNSGI